MTATTIPILPSWDLASTARFYGLLGFVERGRWDDRYLIVHHPAGIEVHFFGSEAFDPTRNDHGGYVRFTSALEVDRLFEAWHGIDLDGGRLVDPSDTDYGLKEGALVDPMGNLLRIGGFLDARPSVAGLFVDTPSGIHAAGVPFWAEAFGSRAVELDERYVDLPDAVPGLAVELQEIDGDPRYHIDFAADDVEDGVRRFESLGATRVRRVETWWIMQAPTGQLFCVVPR